MPEPVVSVFSVLILESDLIQKYVFKNLLGLIKENLSSKNYNLKKNMCELPLDDVFAVISSLTK